MFTLTWLKDAAERALKSAAQSALLIIGGNQLDVLHADWKVMLGAAGGGFVLSVLTSVISAGVGNSGTASLTNAVEPAVAGKHEA